jgi:hypothetical protein
MTRADSPWVNARCHWLDALALAGQDEPGKIRSQRLVPIRMADDRAQAL